MPHPGQSRPVVALNVHAGRSCVVLGSMTPTATHPASAAPPAIQIPVLPRRARVVSAGGGGGPWFAESTGFVSTSQV